MTEIEQIDGAERTIELLESPGVWIRFAIVLEIVRKYDVERIEATPNGEAR